ncbi:nudC domain-containing 3-like [Brachionus plicatilis]|uniref:NudC domain-containing 3-like n=1 Tax=Brachionus plicatilis TaxID=10195 RepID=A0A3M7PMB8_BRAPC|nr:nudC domain-containing 3-like [Brachionus plicatilis]
MNDFENLSAKEERYDDIFLSILQQEGKIEPFLDSVFRFLYRRTDFFLIQETSDQPYGFPPNVAKQIVSKVSLDTFQKYDSIPKDSLKKKLLDSNEEISSKTIQISNAPKSSEELDEQEKFQKDSCSYNGAVRDNYTWTQSIKDIDVRVPINPIIKTSKDVKVVVEKQSLKISVKNQDSWEVIIDDKLAWNIKPDECTWSLFPSDHIHINLEKVQERWWENLLINEPKIDLKKINPEKPLEDLDQESQAKIKQMMYDENQKRLGLPTIEEQKNLDILKKAWDAEGSPFKGTPFDPSITFLSEFSILVQIMADDMEDQFDDDNNEVETETYSSDKKKHYFLKELKMMMYGFGDEENPYQETTIRIMEVNRQNKVQIEDLMYLLRKDPRKYARAKDLLIMNEELKKARKAFDEAAKY